MATSRIYPANGLEIDFLGLPMVFNDGQTENTLKIVLTNNNFFGSLQPDQDTTIVFNQETPVYIWFVVDPRQASADAIRNWALTSNDDFHKPSVALTISPDPGNWKIDRDDSPTGNPLNDSLSGWKLTPLQEVTLSAGQSLVVTLNGLTTALPDGPTSGYCQVKMPNLDAYGDEAPSLLKVFGPIIKSKTIITGDRVGIGTGKPGSTLEVNGGVRARGGSPGNYGINNNGFFFDGVGDNDSGMTSLGDGDLDFYANNVKAINIKEANRQINATVLGDLHIDKDEQSLSSGNLTVAHNVTAEGDLQIGGTVESKGNLSARQQLTVDQKLTAKADLDVQGSIRDTGGKLTVESANKGALGPKLRLINTAGGKGSAAAIEFTGYDSRPETYGDIPAVRISCEDDGNYSGNLIFSTKGTGPAQPLTEQLRLTNDGKLRIKGKAPFIYKRYFSIPAGTHFTDIPASEYVAFIGGYYVRSLDINEDNSHDWWMRMEYANKQTDNWWIRVELPNDDDAGHWDIDVIAIHRNLIDEL